MEWKVKTRARLWVPETPHKQKKQNFMFHWRFNDTLKLRGAKAGQSL